MKPTSLIIYTPESVHELQSALLDPDGRKSGSAYERHIRIPAFARGLGVLRVQGPPSGPALHVQLGGHEVELELCGGQVVVVP